MQELKGRALTFYVRLAQVGGNLGRVHVTLNREHGIALDSCVVAFSLRAKARIFKVSAYADGEPVSTSPENALAK